jgi:dTDP-4-amino-4,6-dideoxygalactose transaminase
MYIPAWPSLNPAYFVKPRLDAEKPFPLETRGSSYFYVARNAIYHLMRILRFGPGDVVLAPDYHHGNEILAMKAAGVKLRYYPIQRNLDADVDALARLCEVQPRPKALYVTHFIGWPQPLHALQRLCRANGLMLIEDCALSFMSDYDRKPLGTFGDYSVFCLYKSLPLPNGGALVSNTGDGVAVSDLRCCSALSVMGRSAELTLQWVRGRSETCGRALLSVKRATGVALNAGKVHRNPIGDSGFDISRVNIGMSPLCHNLLQRFQYERIKEARRRNFKIIADRLRGRVALIDRNLSEGVCPLFFPLLVKDKHNAADRLSKRGIETIEFWNVGETEGDQRESASAFLRRHLLEIPIHQDVTVEAAGFMAEEILKLGQSL